MTEGSYRQFCPVAMAAEILCTRWTMLLLRELVAGSTRFNDLRRGVPRMSPSLLSKRLKDLEEAGVIERRPVTGDPSASDYRLTSAGEDLQPVVEAMGRWGQRWVSAEPSLRNLDPGLLMWDMRRNLDPQPLPGHKAVIAFLYPEMPPSRRRWWLIVDPKAPVDLCSVDPGLDVDLHVVAELRVMTAIWMGLESVEAASARRQLMLTGDARLAEKMQDWLGLSPFAHEPKRATG